MTVKKTAIAVTSSTFVPKKSGSSVTFQITKLGKKPEELKKPTKPVYQYLEISNNKLSTEEFKQATIEFKVNKTWFKVNNYDKNRVTLIRYVNDTYTELPTKKIKEDINFSFYEAKSPSYSYFAIIADKKLPPPKKTTTVDAVEASNQTLDTDSEAASDTIMPPTEPIVEAPKRSSEEDILWIVLLAFSFVLVFVYVFGQNKNFFSKKQDEENEKKK